MDKRQIKEQLTESLKSLYNVMGALIGNLEEDTKENKEKEE
ncbi:MAG: hypothetical protein ACOCUD_01650 [Bacillota bacterium]